MTRVPCSGWIRFRNRVRFEMFSNDRTYSQSSVHCAHSRSALRDVLSGWTMRVHFQNFGNFKRLLETFGDFRKLSELWKTLKTFENFRKLSKTFRTFSGQNLNGAQKQLRGNEYQWANRRTPSNFFGFTQISQENLGHHSEWPIADLSSCFQKCLQS